ncbi:MAG: hypothetical protein AB4060_07890 [Crocosphaera sp.]
MPLIFVHGVSVRETNDEYWDNLARRDAKFRQTVLKRVLNNSSAQIFNPMWGNDVPEIPRPNPIIPPPFPNAPEFGQKNNIVAIPDNTNNEQKLLTLAKNSFPNFIDLLWMDAERLPEVQNNQALLFSLIDAGITASKNAQKDPKPDFINQAIDDEELIDLLIEALKKWNIGESTSSPSFGKQEQVLNAVKTSALEFISKTKNVPDNMILGLLRPSLTQRAIEFFGDALYYQTNRGTKLSPGAIINTIKSVLIEAYEISVNKQEKLIVVGHSMGGNILYDILTYFEPELEVDILVTVGCQASLFRQLKLFTVQDYGEMSTYPEETLLPKPSKVGKWLNVFDPQDILGFAFEPVFEDVEDFFYESPGGIFTAHNDYFKRIDFYERLTQRLLG